METSFVLKKAETKASQFKSPALSMLSAVSGMLSFGGMICLCIVLITQISGRNVNERFFLAAFGVTIICSVAFMLSAILYKRGKTNYLKQRKEMYKTAKKFTGRVIGAVKYVRHINYMKDTYDEILWCFKIEYSDGEELKTVISDKYLNDITEVLKGDKVTVMVLEDNTLAFRNYQLRQNEEESFIKLKTEEIEQETEL